ncbi:MAG: MlaD family protein [Bacteroidales bacterium]|nr:MlaD family protein [Bacteroidales bacterium]
MTRYLIIIIIFFFIGCQSENSINILFDRADGLSEKSKVLLNGSEIGIVKKISIHTDYRVLVKCKLYEPIHIPSDSEIKIISTDILGSKSIYFESGSSNKTLSNNDTVAGLFEDRNLVDTILLKGSEIINDVIDETQTKLDTLTDELQKTNELLDKKR